MKNFGMNKKAVFLGVVFALLMVVSAQAQTIRVTIPFDFRAGQDWYPAGDYRVVVDKQMNRVALAQPNGDSGPLLATFNAYRSDANGEGKLVFHKYGKNYFLASVWSCTSNVGHELIRSNAEKEVAVNGQPMETATLRLVADNR